MPASPPAALSPADHARAVLLAAETVAVLGASSRPERAAFYVPAYLAAQGYQIRSVRPGGGARMHGGPVFGSLGDISENIDVLNIFRRSEALMDHLPEVLALAPGTVWLPLGVRAPAPFAAALAEAGIGLIEDRCMKIDHGLLR